MITKQYSQCTETDCFQSFTKHHQLRAHISTFHSPPGTKQYRCEYRDCSKSFATNQKLRAHQKTHDEKRYTCSHPSCLSLPTLPFFSTWTQLQAHVRTAHPPTCPYPECQGKSFSQQKGLKAHLKVHKGQDVDDHLDGEKGVADDDQPVTKKKRDGDHGRDWACNFEGCTKDFKSVFPSAQCRFHCLIIVGRTEKGADDTLQRLTPSQARFYMHSRRLQQVLRLQAPSPETRSRCTRGPTDRAVRFL